MEVIMKQLRDRTKAGDAFSGKWVRMRSRGETGREVARVHSQITGQAKSATAGMS